MNKGTGIHVGALAKELVRPFPAGHSAEEKEEVLELSPERIGMIKSSHAGVVFSAEDFTSRKKLAARLGVSERDVAMLIS